MAAWSHREMRHLATGFTLNLSPKNLLILGGRFRTESGLVGSLYAFSRSEFRVRGVENPAGIMEPPYTVENDSVGVILGRLG